MADCQHVLSVLDLIAQTVDREFDLILALVLTASMAQNFTNAYRERFGYRPTEPSTEEEARQILGFICHHNGYHDDQEDRRLRESSDPKDQQIRSGRLRVREVLANSTSM